MLDDQDGQGRSACQALLIEADESYRAAMDACMRLAGCRVQQVCAPDLAFPALERRRFDLVVWGVSNSQSDQRGQVISELRLRSEAPLVLIDEDFEKAQVVLEMGADQWVPKPFVPGVLVGSVRAALRTSNASIMQAATRLEIRGMVLDGRRRRLTVGGSETTLTRREWDLLSILVDHPNRFLGPREILRLGWRAGDHAADQLRTYVRRLRLKLEPLDPPCRLVSQHGQGYCLIFD